jgi:hypothetical protein
LIDENVWIDESAPLKDVSTQEDRGMMDENHDWVVWMSSSQLTMGPEEAVTALTTPELPS